MNPFIMMLIQQLLGGTDNSFWNSPFGNSQGSMFGQRSVNPFPWFNPIPGQGQTPQIGRNIQRPQQQSTVNLPGGIAQRFPTLQPMPNEQPIPIPAPLPQVPDRPFGGRPLYGGVQPPMLNPIPTQPVDIPAPFPSVPGRGFEGRIPEPFYIDVQPGLRVPINMTGIFGQDVGLPGRTNTNYLPPVPGRGFGGGRSLY